MLISNWQDYKIIKASNGQKLEKWNNIKLLRPDPIVMWNIGDILENECDAVYYRSNTGGGYWKNIKSIPAYWQIKYNDLVFNIKQMGFKHTGLFPEQAANWDFIIDKIKNTNRKIKVLNLFAYTGGATMSASYAGAVEVVHVDASLGMNEWAKENAKLSGLENNRIRYICDDCLKFVEREKRRGNKYDAIIMDPPTYGRGPSKELWRFEDSLNKLIDSCIDILSDDPLFLLISSYTKGITPEILKNILETSTKDKLLGGKISTDEIGLKITESNMVLPCGIYGRWEKI